MVLSGHHPSGVQYIRLSARGMTSFEVLLLRQIMHVNLAHKSETVTSRTTSRGYGLPSLVHSW